MANTTASAWKTLALLSAALCMLPLSGCDDDDNTDASNDEVVVLPSVALNSRDDVIKAVASVWAYAQPYVAESAPVRPQPQSGETEGQVSEDCADGGSVTFDEDLAITTYDNCRNSVESTETVDDGEGNSVEVQVVDRTVLDGVFSEDCAEDIQTSADRCLTIVPLVTETVQERTQGEGDDAETTTSSTRSDQATFIGVVDMDNGYQLLIKDDRSDRRTQTDGSRSEVRSQIEDFRLGVANTGDADNPAFVLELDGEINFDDLADQSCSTGLVRIGTGEPLSVDPAAGTAPSAGELLLSTADVGGVGVSFASNGDISFRLGGEALSATAEELSQACVGAYAAATDNEDDGGDSIFSGCPFDPLACFTF
nr:hypothetical protein [Oceanococcus sp. HetDA_MAG_MS8]